MRTALLHPRCGARGVGPSGAAGREMGCPGALVAGRRPAGTPFAMIGGPASSRAGRRGARLAPSQPGASRRPNVAVLAQQQLAPVTYAAPKAESIVLDVPGGKPVGKGLARYVERRPAFTTGPPANGRRLVWLPAPIPR
jgi:hypothetical protein